MDDFFEQPQFSPIFLPSGEKVTGGTLMLRNELEIEVHRFGPSIAQNDRMDENNKNMHPVC